VQTLVCSDNIWLNFYQTKSTTFLDRSINKRWANLKSDRRERSKIN